MKRLICFISLLLLVLIFSSCSTSQYTVSEKGDIADVRLKNGKQFQAELIAITDTSIISMFIPSKVTDNPQLISTQINNLKSITIQGYDGSGWGTGVLIFQALPAVLLGIAAASHTEGAVIITLITAIPAAITAILFATSDGDTPQWNDTMSLIDLNKLKIYSRYPENYTPEKQEEILKKVNQKSVKEID